MHRLLLSLGLILGLSGPSRAEDAAGPASPTPAPTAAAEEDEDPRLWLEEVTGERALAWVAEQNKRSEGELASSAEEQALEARLRGIMDSDERIPAVTKMGKYYYNYWKDGEHPHGIWRRTTLKQYMKSAPKWDVILDLDALAASEGKSWVWHGANCLKPDYNRCLISLSDGGSDADVVRELDLRTRSWVADGFTLPEAKSDVSWIDQDTIYVGTDFGPGTLTEAGYARTVRRWTRGTPLDQAPVAFEGQEGDVWAAAWHDDTAGYPRDLAMRGLTFFTNETFLLKDGGWVKLDKPDDATITPWRQWALITLRSDWTVGGKTWPSGSLIVTELDRFLAGERDFQALYTPSARTSLDGVSPTRDHVLVTELDNVRSRVYALRYKGGVWTRAPLEGMPENGSVSVSAVDPDGSNDYFMWSTDYLTPSTLSMGTVGKGLPRQLKSTPAYFNASGLEVSQHEAVSKDGTRVPYFQVARGALELNGKNPTLLNGYGGFEVSMTPYYSGGIGAAWLEKGGVYVVANIRGGGEFGPAWHQAALKQNRNKAYEDFAAVAEDLARRGVTSREHLGAIGGSNGGLLMGNMITTYPQLFGAIVCQVPLLDMKRYSHLLAGASWVGEYGDPDDPAQWAWLKRYSPYQNLVAGTDYPRVLFTTSTRDDRVHPGHARKMAAAMEDLGADVLYYENTEGGHGGAANHSQAAHMWGISYTFLWNELQ